ncbi:acyltransferase family protein [Alteromonas oceanisediminis]|uniref:acyltransferase family protein n=1 Tax=Alteromonas oceanisediminis TaxID=2836180 RepID=UPI001BDA03BE|nr:heparan-alpha-glucosaminide N-acetyltransferase domain-containing protein [Alteromonas oceanisediminis]MBT0585965.1 DUF5009 domain-containing protein [Alteromonas oceanisediminis]
MVAHLRGLLAGLPKDRLLAVDVFRGLAITAMVLVNNPGNWQHVYPPLLHAQWHGWTPTDLIFPFFVFIVGISIVLARSKTSARHVSISATVGNACIRAAKLFGLGLFLAVFYYNFRDPDFSWWQSRIEHIRVLGVLQRLALVYLGCIVLALICSWRGLIIAAALLLLGYTGILLYMPYSDGVQQYQGLLLFGNNAAAYVDAVVLGSQHVYYPTAQPFPFDPEGILSTMPAIASGVTGMLAGVWLLSRKTVATHCAGLLLVGTVALLVGLWLDQFHPINKALWSSTYVLMSSGLAAITLGVLLWILDIKRWRIWCGPLLVFGANSIAFFMFSGVFSRITVMLSVGEQSLKGWLYTHWFAPVFGNQLGSLMYACAVLMISYMLFLYLYRRGWFWKV